MAEYMSAVYEPPDPDMPLVAIVIRNGEVKLAFPVRSVAEGEVRLRLAVHDMRREDQHDDDRR